MELEKLKAPFPPNEVNWRIGQAGKKGNGEVWAKVLAYLDNRCIQDRLDDVCGPENWKNEYAPAPLGGVLCGLSIKIAGEWVTKWDGADNTDIEATKGGLSDAMKRAAVQWGIGRYLYEIGESWAEIVEGKVPGARYANSKVKVNGKEEYVSFNWLPPKGVLPSQPDPELAKRQAAEDEWINDALKQIADAATEDELTKFGTSLKGLAAKQSGRVQKIVKGEVTDAYKARLAQLRQPATNAA